MTLKKIYQSLGIEQETEVLAEMLEVGRWKPYDKKHHKFEEYEAHED